MTAYILICVCTITV